MTTGICYSVVIYKTGKYMAHPLPDILKTNGICQTELNIFDLKSLRWGPSSDFRVSFSLMIHVNIWRID